MKSNVVFVCDMLMYHALNKKNIANKTIDNNSSCYF